MAAKRPAVSVLLPVFDADPQLLRQAVASVLGQSFTDFELLVVEDASPRPAGNLLTSFQDSRIHHLFSPQRTCFTDQLNRGLAAARAPLVARMDGDDVAEPDRLRHQTAYLHAHPKVGVAGCHLRIIDETGQDVGYRAYPTAHDDIVRALRRGNPLPHPGVMFRTALVTEAGGYRCAELHPAEDYELWCRLAARGVRFANLDAPLLRYRIHASSSKSRHTHATLRNTLAIKKMYWDGKMELLDRARFWAERALLLLPPSWIMQLFRLVQYRPAAAVASAFSGALGAAAKRSA